MRLYMASQPTPKKLSRWGRAELYFLTGNYASAQREIEALSQSSSTPLERAAHGNNLEVVRLSDNKTGSLEEMGRKCSAAAIGAGIGAGEWHIEVIVSARYNASLALMKSGRVRDGIKEAEKGVEVVAGYVRSLDVGRKAKKRRRIAVQSWKEKLTEVKRLIEELDLGVLGNGRWMEAAVDVLELLIAGYILLGNRSDALFLSDIAQTFQKVGVLTRPIGTTEKKDEERDNERIAEDILVETDEEAETLEAFLSRSDQGYAAHARNGGRRRFITALIYARTNDWGQALNVLHFDRENALSTSTSIPSYWPAVYLAAVLLFSRGSPSDLLEAKRLFDSCAGAFYRPADAMAMTARAVHGDEALQRWKRTLGMDHARLGALWEGGRCLGRCGHHDQRYTLLSCLREVAKSEKSNGLMGPLDDSEIYTVRLHLSSGLYGITERALAVASAHTLAAMEKWLDALDLINELSSVMSDDLELKHLRFIQPWVLSGAGMAERAVEAANTALDASNDSTEQAGTLLAKAEALTALERIDEALQAVENAFDVAQLSRVAYSEKEIREDPNNLRFLRGLCYNNRGVLLACLGNVRDADESFTAAEKAFEKSARVNRGIDGSEDEITAAAMDFSLAASHNRCLILWRRQANSNAIKHWLARRDIPQDAGGSAADQILQNARNMMSRKQESNVSSTHVQGKLGARERAKMDLLFIEKRRAAVIKERAGALLDDLQKTW